MTPERLKEWLLDASGRHYDDNNPNASDDRCGHCFGAWPCDAYRLAGMVLEVLEIHKPWNEDGTECEECTRGSYKCSWPCPTVQSLMRGLEE